MDHYKIKRYLVFGSFSTVTQSYDERNRRYVAVKQFYNDNIANNRAKKELKMYRYIQTGTSTDANDNFATFYETFHLENRICFAMELLGANLLELMEITKTGFDLSQLQGIARSLLSALAFLHDRRIIHAALKPQHILCHDYTTMTCKIVDLSSCIRLGRARMRLTTKKYCVNHYYRAPESVIKAPFNEKIDIFSVGLIISQLSCKILLIKETHTRKVLVQMVEYLGLPPRELVLNSVNGQLFFYVQARSVTLKHVTGMKRVVPKSKSLDVFFDKFKDCNLVDFIKRCLDMDPEMRGSARGLLSHEWLVKKKTEVKTQRMCTIL